MRAVVVKFLMSMALITDLCVVLQLVWNSQMPQTMQLQNGFWLLGIFVVAVTANHLFLILGSQGRPQVFIRKFLAATVFKFMFYILVLLAFFLFTAENKRALILHFLFYYALFSVLEVSMLYGEISKAKK